MVKIRLRRMGAKNRPSYRVVVADSRFPRDGRMLETLGHYAPLNDPETVVIDKEKAASWLKKGAQPSDTVRRLLAKVGVIEMAPISWPAKPTEAAAAVAVAPSPPVAEAKEAPEPSPSPAP
ncbi:MAG: 30S ribosomal protein S16 [Chloroflexi bacterium]|nr:30S ribosomal protein S16 [Chloroflexota bacterium]